MELAAGVLSYFLCCARTIAALCVFVCFGHLHFGFGLSGARSTEGLASDECQLTYDDDDDDDDAVLRQCQ
jgi:hypothetical protein